MTKLPTKREVTAFLRSVEGVVTCDHVVAHLCWSQAYGRKGVDATCEDGHRHTVRMEELDDFYAPYPFKRAPAHYRPYIHPREDQLRRVEGLVDRFSQAAQALLSEAGNLRTIVGKP